MRNGRRRRNPAVIGIAGLLTVVGAGAGLTNAAATAADAGTPKDTVLTGLPGRTVGDAAEAGAVEIRFAHGPRKTLTAPDPQPGARFGSTIHRAYVGEPETYYDKYTFVGAPGLTVDGQPEAGGIYVYRQESGQTEYLGLLTQAHPKIPGEPQAGAEFGTSIDSFSWDEGCGDTITSLGVGAPGLDVDGADQAGGVLSVSVFRASDEPDAGMEVLGGDLHTLATSDAGVEPTAGDRLGETVYPAYRGCSWGFLVGAPHATVAGKQEAGFVLLARDGRKDQLYYPGTKGIAGTPQTGEEFGSALDGTYENLPGWDIRSHLAIGAPGKRVDGHADAGKVYVLYGTNSAAEPWEWGRGASQESPDDGAGDPVSGHAETGDRFGKSLAYMNHDTKPAKLRLLVGAPGEDIGQVRNAGGVFGLFGAPGSHEGKAGGTPGPSHHFGSAISGNMEGEPAGDEFLIGLPGAADDTGAVAFGAGSDSGTTWTMWTLFSGDGAPGDEYGSGFGRWG